MKGRHYKDQFTWERRLAWVRSKSQAEFRGEIWNLSFAEFCHGFWNTEERWQQRGRKTNDLVLTRYNHEAAWDKNNCCLITRVKHIRAKNRRQAGYDDRDSFKDAIYYGQ